MRFGLLEGTLFFVIFLPWLMLIIVISFDTSFSKRGSFSPIKLHFMKTIASTLRHTHVHNLFFKQQNFQSYKSLWGRVFEN